MIATFWASGGGRIPWLWLVCGAIVLFIAAAWSCASRGFTAHRFLCFILRACGISALLFCLMDLQRLVPRVTPGANAIAIVADNSISMRVKDRGEQTSRAEHMQALLDPIKAGWITELEQSFEVHRFSFDSRPTRVVDCRHMSFDGVQSHIGTALREVAQRFERRPLAGIILFTDGISTDNPDEVLRTVTMPPVYPVMIGRASGIRDLAIASAKANLSAFEDAPVTVKLDVTAVGWRGEEVVARLFNEDGRLLAEQVRTPRKDPETFTLEFKLRREKPGLSFYHVCISGRNESEGETGKVEATLLNNACIVPVERSGGPYRVLYVAGRPNWEYKYLKRALETDEQIQLVGLIRVAKREPKFEFIGRPGETGNPIFRGFGDQSREGTERYDLPVLLRLDTRDEHELSAGFPRTAEELYEYHAIILDDVEPEFFEPVQLALIRSFVAERGGGLIMFGGLESFADGGWQNTPVSAVLPVYLEGEIPQTARAPYKLCLTREGFLEPWARLCDNEQSENARRLEMPLFNVLNLVGRPKPGASLIATVTDAAGRELPGIVTHRYGRGRSAAITVGDMWRWGMNSPETRSDMEKFWRQLVRWLTSDVPRRVESLAITDSNGLPGTVKIETRVRDRKFQPVDDAVVLIDIGRVQSPFYGETNRGATTPLFRIRAEVSDAEVGLYTATFTTRETAAYRASVVVNDSAGAEIGRTEVGWSVDTASSELKSVQPNPSLLARIAKRTGGELIAPSQLAELARRLPKLNAPVMETISKPAWHTPLLFVAALLCFSTEWWLRRRHGLP